jgi:dTDP-glucose pyrophosphorylase
MKVLILAAGSKKIVSDDNYPFALTEFNGKPIIQHLIEKCATLNPTEVIFALQEEDVRKYHLDAIILLLMPQAKVMKVQGYTLGACCTALLSSAQIENDEELLIINGNELLDIDFTKAICEFKSRNLNAGVVVFDSVHPRYSYVRLNEEGHVVEAAEKRPISRNATAGFYWYSNGRLFVNAAKDMIRKRASTDGVYYICPSFNELILKQLRIGIHVTQASNYHPLKTGRQVDRLEAVIGRSPNHGNH